MPQAADSATRPGIAAICFDAFGTLFDVRGVDGLCESLFPGHGERLSALWRRRQLEYSWLLALMNRYENFARVTERALGQAMALLRLDGSEASARLLAFYDRLPLFPDAAGALTNLGERYELAILSNGSPDLLQTLVQQAGIADRLGHLFSADSVRTYKPHPRVYAVATDGLKRARERIAFVSSNGWDVAGSSNYGFRTVYLNRSGAPQEALDLPAEAAIDTLTDLGDALDAMSSGPEPKPRE